MSQPSGTNSPKASNTNSERNETKSQGVSLSATYAFRRRQGRARYYGGNSSGDPPLPIPNREVKPARAYDTAIPSGKVGSRQFKTKSSAVSNDCRAFLFSGSAGKQAMHHERAALPCGSRCRRRGAARSLRSRACGLVIIT